jgi:DNA polymerase-3 subunit epsilon
MLADKPRFSEVLDEFMEFVDGAELIIHNAPFDMGFLNYEFRLLQGETFDLAEQCDVLDTLIMARKLHPGMRNSLDALCKRYDVDNSGRQLHGALLDAEILADVYLAMTGGQASLSLDTNEEAGRPGQQVVTRLDNNRKALRVIHAADDEVRAHEAYLSRMEETTGYCVWLGLNETTH